MKLLILRFYRYFFSSKGRSKIKRAAYLLLFIWFMCVFVQRALYPEHILSEWYYFYFSYPIIFYIVIFLLPWTRYTLFSKLRLFQVFICLSIFTLGTTLYSLRAFLLFGKTFYGFFTWTCNFGSIKLLVWLIFKMFF